MTPSATPTLPLLILVREAPRWLLATWAVALGYLVWLLTGLPGAGFGGRTLDLTLLSLINLVVIGMLWRASRRVDLPLPVRFCLRLFGTAQLLSSFGAVYLVAEKALHLPTPGFFSVADGFFMAASILVIIGLISLPAGEKRAAGLSRILVDGAAFVVGLGVPLWLFALENALKTMTGIEATLLVLWPFLAFCGILTVNTTLLTKAPLPSRAALWMLLAGSCLSSGADLLFTLDASSRLIARGPVDWVNLANGLSLCLYLFAAWRFQVDPMPKRSAARPAAFSPVPMLAIIVITGWLVLLATTAHRTPVAMERVLPGLILLFVLLAVRETLVMRDSRRWMALEAQRENQARFEALVRNSSDAILIVDQSRHVRFASPASTSVLGANPDSLLGRTLLGLAHPEDVTELTGFLDALQRDPGVTRQVQWRLRNADGSYRNLETAGSNLLTEATIEGLVLNSRDVTERLALEERLQHAGKMEAIGRLAGGVAHDFNNLLAVIQANSELALMSLPATHAARADIEEVRRTTTRGATLTNRLLSFSRREKLPPRVIAPSTMLKELTPVLQRLLSSSLVLNARIDTATGFVKVNPDALEQALINLTTNARDASPAGGTVTLSVRSATLAEALPSAYLSVKPGRYVVIEVADTGMGMSELTRTKLFEPFFTTKPQGKGTGLGLASVYATVKIAGGGITVQSKPGQGTTIGLWLPEVSPEAGVTPAPAVMPVAGGNETILLVEDEELVRSATCRLLQSKGYHVLVASDGVEAQRVLAAQPATIHLLLTDVMMPGMTGPALAAELVKQRPGLRVLYMSGYTGNELDDQGFGLTDTRLLVKPFSAELLQERVRAILTGPAGLA